MKTITLQGTKLALKTPYDEDEIAALKASFPKARWDRLNKQWLLPVTDLPKNRKLRTDIKHKNVWKDHYADNTRICWSHEYIGQQTPNTIE